MIMVEEVTFQELRDIIRANVDRKALFIAMYLFGKEHPNEDWNINTTKLLNNIDFLPSAHPLQDVQSRQDSAAAILSLLAAGRDGRVPRQREQEKLDILLGQGAGSGIALLKTISQILANEEEFVKRDTDDLLPALVFAGLAPDGVIGSESLIRYGRDDSVKLIIPKQYSELFDRASSIASAIENTIERAIDEKNEEYRSFKNIATTSAAQFLETIYTNGGDDYKIIHCTLPGVLEKVHAILNKEDQVVAQYLDIGALNTSVVVNESLLPEGIKADTYLTPYQSRGGGGSSGSSGTSYQTNNSDNISTGELLAAGGAAAVTTFAGIMAHRHNKKNQATQVTADGQEPSGKKSSLFLKSVVAVGAILTGALIVDALTGGKAVDKIRGR